ncbi:MAG: hypothetical protein V3S33_07065 [Gammaproteobacteria bacterium]
MRRLLVLLTLAVTGVLTIAACDPNPRSPQQHMLPAVREALQVIGLSEPDLTLPKLGGMQVSEPGRLTAVDTALRQPLAMIELAQRVAVAPDTLASAYIARLLAEMELHVQSELPRFVLPPDAAEIQDSADYNSEWAQLSSGMPAQWDRHDPFFRALRQLLYGAVKAQQAYRNAGGNPTTQEIQAVRDHLATIVSSVTTDPRERRLTMTEYHDIGKRIDIAGLSAGLLGLLAAAEQALSGLGQAPPDTLPMEWETPLGNVRISGTGDDVHTGDFLLLIDLGGNDTYEEVGAVIARPGNVTVVIDLAGDDHIQWRRAAGPGAGILGIGLWIDMQGDDRYEGTNVGLGAGLLGAGLLWDMQGDDLYLAGSMVEGAGRYGLGVLLDEKGNDRYQTQLDGQGFGGEGGIGMLVDLVGEDRYLCGGFIPDQMQSRAKRHGPSPHYLGMCQGYGFGRRPDISGGIGVLLDRRGDDHYRADLFAQASAYWFGLGMLVDSSGNDRYEAFEHCQGEGLHLSAAILADGGGDDYYSAYEHAQGVGIDRAAGILYDHTGNDSYNAHRKSQGAGLKPFGFGFLLDAYGDDAYQAAESSQGYAAEPTVFPENQRPVGVLVDLLGNNRFTQFEALKPVSPDGRIQNKQGIAVGR